MAIGADVASRSLSEEQIRVQIQVMSHRNVAPALCALTLHLPSAAYPRLSCRGAEVINDVLRDPRILSATTDFLKNILAQNDTQQQFITLLKASPPLSSSPLLYFRSYTLSLSFMCASDWVGRPFSHAKCDRSLQRCGQNSSQST
jgi:hypothetical protein